MKSLRECTNIREGKIIKVSEQKKSFILNNPDKTRVKVVRIDGCVFDISDDGLRCDYLFRPVSVSSDLFIELKGIEVKHAVNQIENTIQHVFSIDPESKDRKRFGYIVCSRYPKDDGKLKILSRNLKRKYQCEIKIKNFVLEEHLANVV